MDEAEGIGTPCLDEIDLASWVDGTMGDEERLNAFAHLAVCPACGRAAASLVQAMGSTEIAPLLDGTGGAVWGKRLRPRFFRRAIGVAGVAAAAVVAGLLVIQPSESPVEQAPVQRDTGSHLAPAPELRAPLGAVEGPVEFVWSEVRGSDLYRITVYGEDGGVTWESETEGTGIALPEAVELAPGVQYLWKVAARIQLGRWVSSGLAGFSISGS
jgi:hypothetical protein